MFSDPDTFPDMLAELRDHFDRGLTRSLQWRREQLSAISRMLEENEARVSDALAEDLGKPQQEVLLGETALIFSEVEHARKRLKRWTKARRVPTPMVGKPGRSWVQPEPFGVVLIIGAWNYPIQLLLSPLIPAIAAGNCAVLKPSEVAVATSKLLAELVPQYLDERAVRVVEGAVEETTELLKQRFDHIFYTGSSAVGKIVMRAAAEHLTPVTLELGGKSPCVIDAGADIESAARRLIWGKCLNAGQTCIAPDYVLVRPADRDRLIGAIEHELFEMYGADRLGSSDYCKIINRRHFDRLRPLIDSGRVVIGGRVDETRCRIEPTVLTEVAPDSALMQEEIFGPILPIMEVDDLEAAIAFIREREKPLSAYLFTRSGESERRFSEAVSTGNLCINDTLMFMSVPELPFGGVGNSGMGQYHGKAGFDRLSHLKAVMKRGLFPEIPVRFPPYSKLKMRLLKWVS
ncbi:MAG: aldehyde dehydrogenase family protein [Gammaproteobacteria bacterium]|jgi:aldehyde dehydrogenase (NAD+)|nr:aldehyde dehydrogenase family protein [Gammaproteobacteria bacterium]